jgi:LemA protein
VATDLVLAVVVLTCLGLAALYGTSIYNRLVRAEERTREAWSGIDVQLRRRASLVPSLVEAVRGYSTHEREVFEEVARARGGLVQAEGPAESAGANLVLTRALGRLLAVVERYPQLKASKNFQDLQDDLYDIEEKIAFARQFYNRNAAEFNTRIRSIPDVAIARLAGSGRFEFFEAEEGTEADVRFSFAPAASSSIGESK